MKLSNCWKKAAQNIWTLHNGMILSTLSISSHGFALSFPKRPHTPNPNNPQQSSPRTKHTISLPLIEARLLSLEVTFDHIFEALLAWLGLGHGSDTMLGITTLHNGMILSTLSIKSHGFALGFPKKPHTNGDSIPHS
ncbi:hypothetical protein SDJN02_18513, partial [Cucurbita argyrosperma subsp. argyrosperma]